MKIGFEDSNILGAVLAGQSQYLQTGLARGFQGDHRYLPSSVVVHSGRIAPGIGMAAAEPLSCWNSVMWNTQQATSIADEAR
jgi:hypothetical protein